MEEEIGDEVDEIPLQDLGNLANEQVEIEDYFLPKRRGESNRERIKRVAITAVLLVTRRALHSSSKKLKLQKQLIDSKTNPIAINWITDGGSAALDFVSKNLWVVALVGVSLFLFWRS